MAGNEGRKNIYKQRQIKIKGKMEKKKNTYINSQKMKIQSTAHH